MSEQSDYVPDEQVPVFSVGEGTSKAGAILAKLISHPAISEDDRQTLFVALSMLHPNTIAFRSSLTQLDSHGTDFADAILDSSPAESPGEPESLDELLHRHRDAVLYMLGGSSHFTLTAPTVADEQEPSGISHPTILPEKQHTALGSSIEQQTHRQRTASSLFVAPEHHALTTSTPATPATPAIIPKDEKFFMLLSSISSLLKDFSDKREGTSKNNKSQSTSDDISQSSTSQPMQRRHSYHPLRTLRVPSQSSASSISIPPILSPLLQSSQSSPVPRSPDSRTSPESHYRYSPMQITPTSCIATSQPSTLQSLSASASTPALIPLSATSPQVELASIHTPQKPTESLHPPSHPDDRSPPPTSSPSPRTVAKRLNSTTIKRPIFVSKRRSSMLWCTPTHPVAHKSSAKRHIHEKRKSIKIKTDKPQGAIPCPSPHHRTHSSPVDLTTEKSPKISHSKEGDACTTEDSFSSADITDDSRPTHARLPPLPLPDYFGAIIPIIPAPFTPANQRSSSARSSPQPIQGQQITDIQPLIAEFSLQRSVETAPPRASSTTMDPTYILPCLHQLPGVDVPRVLQVLSTAESLSFDAFELGAATQGHALCVMGYYALKRMGLMDAMALDEEVAVRFLLKIDSLYNNGISYHTSTHAADVVQLLLWLLRLPLPEQDALASITSSTSDSATVVYTPTTTSDDTTPSRTPATVSRPSGEFEEDDEWISTSFSGGLIAEDQSENKPKPPGRKSYPSAPNKNVIHARRAATPSRTSLPANSTCHSTRSAQSTSHPAPTLTPNTTPVSLSGNHDFPCVSSLFSPTELFSAFFAAICHDVGHPGVSNAFLLSTEHPLAEAYNFRSPLENYHTALGLSVLRGVKGCDVVGTSGVLADNQKLRARWRTMVVEEIMATDASILYFTLMKELRARIDPLPKEKEIIKSVPQPRLLSENPTKRAFPQPNPIQVSTPGTHVKAQFSPAKPIDSPTATSHPSPTLQPHSSNLYNSISARRFSSHSTVTTTSSSSSSSSSSTSTSSPTVRSASSFPGQPLPPSTLDPAKSEADRLLLLQSLMVLADMGNQLRPTSVALKASTAVQSEFFLQGDREREWAEDAEWERAKKARAVEKDRTTQPPPTTSTVSKFMDRFRDGGDMMMGMSQMGYIDFLLRPVVDAVSAHLRIDLASVTHIRQNRHFWEGIGRGGTELFGSKFDAITAGGQVFLDVLVENATLFDSERISRLVNAISGKKHHRETE